MTLMINCYTQLSHSTADRYVRKDESMAIVSNAHKMEAVNQSILSLVQPHHSRLIDEENESDTSYSGARVQGRMS